MAIAPRLEMRQSQNLVMTAQLQQSIKLLQLSSMELTEFIAEQMEQNPLLTRDESDSNSTPNDEFTPQEEQPRQAQEETGREDVVDYNASHTTWEEGGGADSMLDAPREAFWDDAEGGSYSPSAGAQRTSSGSHDELNAEFESNLTEAPSLKDHLLEQLQMDISDPVKRMIGLHIIDLIDERGYVPEDLSAVCEGLKCDPDDIEEVLKELQQFSPSGVCARNLGECLAIQLRELDRFDPSMEKMIQNLELIASGNVKQLAKVCGVEEEDISFMYEEIRALNPKPGLQFGHDVMQVVVPDVFLRKASDGGWQVELNSDALPKVLLNRQYYTRISGSARRKEDKKYLSEQLAHANWLTKALDQRAQTILKVSTEIVRQQDAFFRQGVRHFKPLTLRDIAEAVDIHESTVSRVTTQKYLSNGSAVYELKYFFSSGLSSTNAAGDQHSSEAVKHMIKDLIDAENPKDILSDDTIAEMLQAKGVDIARRTVAKYREAMDIGSSPARRRDKKNMSFSQG